MDFTTFSQIFTSAASKNGISLPNEAQLLQFYRFTEHLLEVNAHTNLTAIREPIGVVDKHYIDSLLAMDLIPKRARVLDLGCGPGFPSIPLAIMRPDLEITALDSTTKKIDFVQKSAEILQLSNLKGVSGRAEDTILRKALGKYDIVVSRAVARLNILLELTAPFVKVGGCVLAMKGTAAMEELEEAKKAIKTLGLKLEEVKEFPVDGTAHTVIVLKKVSPTPAKFPRRFAKIKQAPL